MRSLTTAFQVRITAKHAWVFPLLFLALACGAGASDVGRRFPSEKKIITDEVTGAGITVLTSSRANDIRIYHTHPQWTAGGRHVVFRSKDRSSDGNDQIFAVNEKTGEIVQLTDGPGLGIRSITLSPRRNLLYYVRTSGEGNAPVGEIVELDLDPLLHHGGRVGPGVATGRVVARTNLPLESLALDADGKRLYARGSVRKSGAGLLSAIHEIDIATGDMREVLREPFSIGHLQANPLRSGELLFCNETGGDAPQRMWIRRPGKAVAEPLYPERADEWVTHEAYAGRNQVIFNLIGFSPELRLRPTGLAIVDTKTGKTRILGQPKPVKEIEDERGFWHCNVSPDGRWAVGDTFCGNVYLVDRKSGDMTLLTSGHRMEPDHAHPSFSPDGHRVLIQSGKLSGGKDLDLMVVDVPEKMPRK